MNKVVLHAALAGVCASIFAAPAIAAGAADFYKDKTVTVLIGAGMGGSYGLYGQLTSNFIGPRPSARKSTW